MRFRIHIRGATVSQSLPLSTVVFGRFEPHVDNIHIYTMSSHLHNHIINIMIHLSTVSFRRVLFQTYTTGWVIMATVLTMAVTPFMVLVVVCGRGAPRLVSVLSCTMVILVTEIAEGEMTLFTVTISTMGVN